MKFWIYLFVLLASFSCNNAEEARHNEAASSYSSIDQSEGEKDTINTEQDSLVLFEKNSKTDSIAEKNIEKAPKFQKMSKADSFLLKPFDLYKFKEKAGQSNSSATGKKSYFYKPKYNGVCYNFHLINIITYNGNYSKAYKYLKPQIHETALNITSYKPDGKFRNEYLDPNEELIELEATTNVVGLKEFAFIGLDTLQVYQRLGNENFIKNNCLVYHYNNRVLILSMKDGKIQWLRYVHLSFPLKKESDIGDIYQLAYAR